MNRWSRRALGAVAVLAFAGAASLLWAARSDEQTCDGGLRDLDGRCAVLDDPVDVVGADLQPTGGRFQAPEQGVDVPLVEMTITGGLLNPPTLTDAFLVRASQAQGTFPRLVVMHAVHNGRAPGNAFFEPDVADPAVTVDPGDPLIVDGVAYTVTAVEILAKSDAATAQSIWGEDPDGESRLVVVTCLQRAGRTGPAAENLVIYAVRS